MGISPNGWWISLATGVWHARDCRILWAEGLLVTGARGLGLAGARERRFGDSDSVRRAGKLISEYLHGRDGEDGPGQFEAIIRCDVIIGENEATGRDVVGARTGEWVVLIHQLVLFAARLMAEKGLDLLSSDGSKWRQWNEETMELLEQLRSAPGELCREIVTGQRRLGSWK